MQSFREDLERSEQDGTEWQFGVVTKDLAAVPVSLRLVELPAGVLQYNNVMDTVGCASRGPNNILETKLDYFYDNGMHPDIKKWFDQNGYRVNGKFALNDAFIEILSGTTPTGNSLKAPLDAIRKNGAIPAALIPLEDGMNWAEYMDKKRLTQAHKDLGQEFLKRITINYEQVYVSGFEKAVDVDLLDTALSAWSLPVDGVYPPIEGPFNHCVARVTNEIDIFDNYVPFVKRLAKNYKFFDWGYSLSITAQNPNPEITTTVFDVLKKNGLLAYFADWLTRFINATANPPPLTPPPPPILTNSKLDLMCSAIKEYEGWYPGSRSYRNNSPGNVRYSSVGYLPIYGNVKRDYLNFAIFPTYDLGWLYLKNLLKSKAAKNPTWSLSAFFKEYAPSYDNNDPIAYATFVAKKMGVSAFAWEIKGIL